MDPIRRFDKPELRQPRVIVAFEGWNDACDAASGAASYLLGQYDVEPFAIIEPEEFFDFQSRRPLVQVEEGGTRGLTWPTTRFYAIELHETPHDLLVVLGEEPNLKWKTYSRLVAQVLSEADAELVVTLGAFIGQVAHTLPVPIVGVATDPELVTRHDLLMSGYEGPTGITGVLLEACREAGIPTMGLWAATPHYLAANPNPKAMRALLGKACMISGIPVDTAELDRVVTEFDARVDSAMTASEDFTTYVQRLEQSVNTEPERVDQDTREQLIEDIEQFLRDQG